MAQFLEQLQKDLADANLWSVLSDICGMKEVDRSAILRPYDEGGFSTEQDDRYRPMRAALDRALDILTILEIAFQIGVIQAEAVGDAGLLHKDGALQYLVNESGAFLRYVSAYGYYGVRMLAYRKFRPSWESFNLLKENHRAFTLVNPPSLSVPDAGDSFDRFLHLENTPDWEVASSFLDGILPIANLEKTESTGISTLQPGEAAQYELWLMGLLPLKDTDPLSEAFCKITDGIVSWAKTRVTFYRSLTPSTPPSPRGSSEGEAALAISNPLAARFALADIYWIARILRADISANASVRYAHSSWLSVMRAQKILANEGREAGNSLIELEENLRIVFDFVCDLIHNSADLTERRELEYSTLTDAEKEEVKIGTRCAPGDDNDSQDENPTCPKGWRAVFDEELRFIDQQRSDRVVADRIFDGEALPLHGCRSDKYWSERLTTGKQPHNRIGLASSGGGIRSATFNLGVLQGLQEFDQLRYIDYLSTVSGGGFIGSWLVGNVKRAKQWLGRTTCWDDSIAHLRAYSSYLAPRTGILSADTWTLGVSWVRNAFLIQLTTLAWLLALLLIGWIGRETFLLLPGWRIDVESICARLAYGIPLVICGVVLVWTLVYNFRDSHRIQTGKDEKGEKIYSARAVRWLAVVPSWFGGFVLASLMWMMTTQWSSSENAYHYSYVLLHAWNVLIWFLLLSAIALGILAWLSLTRVTNWRRVLAAVGIAVVCVIILYLALCAVLYLYLVMVKHDDLARFGSYAFVFGPSLVLSACTLSVVIFIGLSGRNSREAQREWWTRYGTWLLIYAIVGLALSFAALFGPRILIKISGFAVGKLSGWKSWSALISWAGTSIAGLLAGNSSKTSGNPANGNTSGSKRALEMLAKLGGFVFIIGAVLGAATVLYFVVLNIATNDSYADTGYWLLFEHAFSSENWWKFAIICVAVVLCGLLFSWLFDINIFGLSQLYRNRLVRCYLGATRWTPGMRSPQPFTKFDFKDDLFLSELKSDFRGPFPIFNCTLNLGGSSDLTVHSRHSASFTLTPVRCGADRPKLGFAQTGDGTSENSFAGGMKVGQAVAVSGAAASPNMGYNTSPLAALLLTLFNVRLGWWFPNPSQECWNKRGLRSSLYYLTRELFGIADETRNYVNVSDGGHFENLGVYELIRRRCKVIIAADAECDESLQFESLGNLVRICATDFGAYIDIDVRSIRQQKDGHSLAHSAIGKIKYSNGSIGYLIYLKSSVTGDEDIGVAQYRAAHPSFPHETTANQFFAEDQFEAYRKLGLHIATQCLRGVVPGTHPLAVAKKLVDTMSPTRTTGEAFLKHSQALDRLWEQCRQIPSLHSYLDELMAIHPPVAAVPAHPNNAHQQSQELCMTLQMAQLMEDVFMDLQLDDFWTHPDNRGWAILFMRWSRSPRFRTYWEQIHRTFGIRFEYFCADRLGLIRDKLIVRV